jgi:hypothetical protein
VGPRLRLSRIHKPLLSLVLLLCSAPALACTLPTCPPGYSGQTCRFIAEVIQVQSRTYSGPKGHLHLSEEARNAYRRAAGPRLTGSAVADLYNTLWCTYGFGADACRELLTR